MLVYEYVMTGSSVNGTLPASFRDKYGPWAVVAGASEGIGGAFAQHLAKAGLNVLLIARNEEKLEAFAESLRSSFGVEVKTLALDLSSERLEAEVWRMTDNVQVGLLVYNAAFAPISDFVSLSLDEHRKVIDVNCVGPVTLAHLLAPRMVERRRGGLIFMSSLAGFHGAPFISTYSATKAFNRVFAEALWEEFRDSNVDVLATCAGATRTPTYLKVTPKDKDNVPSMEPSAVAWGALNELGGGPTYTPGLFNKVSGAIMQRVLPRKAAVRLLGKTMRDMYKS